MPFCFKRDHKKLIIFVSGALSFHQHREGEQLIYQVTTLVDQGEIDTVCLNFTDVQRMDSHWLGVLIRILRRVREKSAQFVIEKPNRDIRHLFEMVELSRITEIRI